MKVTKKALSILLSLMLALGAVSVGGVSASALDVRALLDIGGETAILDGNIKKSEGTGWSIAETVNGVTLNLNNPDLTYDDIVIYAQEFDLTITGSAKLTSTGTESATVSVNNGNLTLNGDFTILSQSETGSSLSVNGNLTVEGGSVYAKTESSSYSAISAGEIILNNGEVFALGDEDAKEVLITDAVQISDYAGLKAYAVRVNNGEMDLDGVLTADINASASADANDWTPIGDGSGSGNSKIKYTGTFDGLGHKITGLTFNNPQQDYAGLFGYVGEGGKVQNVGLEGGSIKGQKRVGGVVGHNEKGTVTSCYNTGAVSGSSDVGGVVGFNYSNSTISNCYNTGNVTATAAKAYAGGVAGYNSNNSSVSNCYNTGDISGSNSVGGVVGNNYMNSSVENCYNTGAVSGSSDVGGVVGLNYSNSTISNCYNTGAVSGSNYVGGVVGDNSSNSSVENCYNTGSVTAKGIDAYVGGVVGENFSSSTILNCYNAGSVTATGADAFVGGVAGENYGNSTAEYCYYDSVRANGIPAIGNESNATHSNVEGLATDLMTGENALENMVFAFKDGEESPWLTKANEGIIKFYPHLRGFAYDSEPTGENWPPKIAVYPLWVGGNQVTSDNMNSLNALDGISVADGGSVKFVPDADGKGGTLYLNNATITGTQEYDYPGAKPSNILVENTEFDLTINLEGENIINGRADRGIWLPRNTYDAALKIEGEGSIDITAVTFAIMCNGSLTIDGTTVNATSTRVEHSGFGISSYYINITGSSVKSESISPDGFGLYANASLNIADSTVEATGGQTGIYVDNSTANEGLTVSGISIVTAEGGNQFRAIFSRGGYHFKDGNDIVTPENFKYGTSGSGTIILNSDDSPATTVVIGQPCAVTFKNFDGTELQSGKILKGTAPEYKGETPVRTDESGQYTYAFSGWKDGNNNEYAPGATFPAAQSDITYTAQFTSTPVDYTVTFYVDGEQYSQSTVPFGAPVSSPRTPQKKYYDFTGWDKVIPDTMPAQNLEFNAVFKAIGYTAKFVNENGETVREVPYTVETESIKDKEPAVPGKDGYTGEWEDYTLTPGGITVEPVYETVTYTATFVNENGETVKEVPYTVETGSIKDKDPEVPGKDGYTGKWKEYTLAVGGITVEPVYETITYTATFVNENGETVKEIPYTVETGSIKDKEPEVPGKDGYTGEWEEYKLEIGGVTVEPEYTAIEYTATFVADGKTAGEVKFTVETEKLKEPAVPVKEGYEGKWSGYTIAASDMTVNAEYTAIEYKATFVADGKTVAEIPYTVETKSIEAPAVPEKEGYTGEWEEYKLAAGGITVNAVYTEIDNPDEPDEPESEDLCPLDEKDHGTSFWGKLIRFIHTVIYKLFKLFGLNIYFRINHNA